MSSGMVERTPSMLLMGRNIASIRSKTVTSIGRDRQP